MSRTKFDGQVAVVTGAGSGIGRALALALARRGCKLALADVNADTLAETARLLPTPSLTRALDVADRAAVHAFAAEVEARLGPADLVFNNAGVALIQTISDTRHEDLEWLMNINFYGVVHGCQAFLPAMLARRSGVLVNVSSLYGLIGWPAQTAYCAAKFAVRGYTEAMRHDLHGTGVRAVCVHPGGIRTNIVRAARFTRDDLGREDAAPLIAEFDRFARMSPERAASVILQGVERGDERIVVGADAKLLSLWQRVRPEGYFKIVRWFGSRFR